MQLALAIPALDTALVVAVLEALADYNARTWWSCSGSPLGCPVAPWGIAYRPDPPGATVTIRDVHALQARGYGGCGELAAAYVGWARAMGISAARVDVRETGPGRWHAVAIINGQVFDPAWVAR